MTDRAIKPITVTLGEMTKRAQAHVASGRYGSISEVVRAGLRALDREEAALDALIKARVEQALADPRPLLSGEDVSASIAAHHANRRARDA
ncbi:type II toxin-antitoxin system ParD family antitoxin [Sphingomonas colocasiae]|uniref:Type II toxin-antitoxin system ParD family antitoxin n=1 Tax=Sphingomonas colocasiae TaxID=1848973 RepID=A0ABS7PXU1_9SPHN|nr:type II toxin-antitoxin system ParD family antitoxin [Sphingomonas colocasiae]MBY8825480.1 type II toxin-antitoxin system ParD family antitoxin [Sphingomonas colocasiae]